MLVLVAMRSSLFKPHLIVSPRYSSESVQSLEHFCCHAQSTFVPICCVLPLCKIGAYEPENSQPQFRRSQARGRGAREGAPRGQGSAPVRQLIVSSTRLRRTRLRRGRSPTSSDQTPRNLPHAPDEGGTTTGRRRTRPGEGLPPPVPTQTRGSLRAVMECAGTCIKRRQHPQVPLQLDTTLTEIVRNDVHLQTFRQVVDTDCRDTPPRMLFTL
jgi:hypothetical protein